MVHAPQERSEVPARFRQGARVPESHGPGASDKQLNFLASLLQEREMEDEPRRQLSVRLAAQTVANEAGGDKAVCEDGITGRRASEFIKRMLELPKRRDNEKSVTSRGPSPEELPKGRYAITGKDGTTKFFHVWRGDRNEEYVKLYILHGPYSTEVTPFGAARAILREIVKRGAWDAALRYGDEIGACSECNRRLTNHISRKLKIGPVCGGHHYQDPDEWKAIRQQARDELRAAGINPDGSVPEDESGTAALANANSNWEL